MNKTMDNEIIGIKRRRSSNFTPEEKLLLVQLVSKYAYVLENKKTDSVSWKDKEAAWMELGKEFNAKSPSGIYRSSDSLKKLYENQKKTARKDAAEEKIQLLKTGGGPPPPSKPKDDAQELLLSIMNEKTVSGLRNPFDSDNIMFEIVDENIENTECLNSEGENNSNGETSLDWGNFKASHLQTPLHQNLKSKIENFTSSNNNKETPSKSNTSNTNWVNRRRPVIKSLSTSNLSNEYSELVKIKIELAKVQLEIAKGQLMNNDKESKLRIENLEVDNEIKKLQLQLLKKQL